MIRPGACALLIAAAIPNVAEAAPPPPPADYVYAAEAALAEPAVAATSTRLAALLSRSVRVFENGQPVADGSEASLAWLRKQVLGVPRRVIGHAESSAGFRNGYGELLVVDEFDSVERSRIPPGILVDPWRATRAILCRFGADHRISEIRVSTVGGFWEATQAR